MSKHAILMPKWIGDFILALSVVEYARPSSADEYTLIVPSGLQTLCNQLSQLSTINFNRQNSTEFRSSLNRIREARFDTITLLPHSFSTAWFALRCGIKHRRGINSQSRGVLLTEKFPKTLRNRSKHITQEYATLLGAPFHEPEEWQGRHIAGQSLFSGYMVFCPGANYGKAKQWQGFCDLAKLFPHEKIIVLGGPDAIADGKALASIEPGRIEDYTTKTTLSEAAVIIANAKVVVSNDTGLMHLAGYLGTPTVAIFGSSSPAWTRPIGSKNTILYAKELCSPCLERTCKLGDYRCLSKISAEQVAGVVFKNF